MVLFSCPECGKQISDKSKFCPNCGLPCKYYSPDKKKAIILHLIEKRSPDNTQSKGVQSEVPSQYISFDGKTVFIDNSAPESRDDSNKNIDRKTLCPICGSPMDVMSQAPYIVLCTNKNCKNSSLPWD